MLVKEIVDDMEEVVVEDSKNRRQSNGTGRRRRRNTHAGAFSVVAVHSCQSRFSSRLIGGKSAGDQE